MAKTVKIESTDTPFRCVCSNGVHTWYADEPVSKEGLDTAPSPEELLLSAIGTCAIITLRMFANRKQWTIGKIYIDLSLEEIKTETGTINRIHETLTIDGPIDDEQFARLKSILPKCPVTKIVTGQVEISYN
ncbi:MAG: OsmC family protein [Saprospiraceae bacterium]